MIDIGDFKLMLWCISYALGLLLFFTGIVYLLRKKQIREEHFIKAGAFEFLSSWILFFPEEFFNDIPESAPVLHAIESVFTALLRTFNIYLGNGYSRITCEDHPVFSSIYATLATMANIALLLFVAGFIVRLLDGPVQRIKLSLFKRRYSYIFPVCNDKTLAIAKSIQKRRVNLIFVTCNDDLGKAEKHKITGLNGIYIDDSITSIIDKLDRKSRGIEIFLFGDKEEDNLSELEKICNKINKDIKPTIRVFVELSETPWNLYDNFLKEHNRSDTGKMIINFVRTEENFVYNNLLKNSIFENAKSIKKDEDKSIKILLVGMNERSLEMLKALLHLGQMPGYKLTVMILDSRKGGRKMLQAKLPEVYDDCNKVGDAVYSIIYKEEVDYNVLSNELDSGSEDYSEIIKEQYPDFTFAYINTGNDLLNVNIAVDINALCYRLGRKNEYKIQVNVGNQEICNEWNDDLTENLQFVGDQDHVYNYEFITMSDIERGTVSIHNVRHPVGTDKYKSWTSYCNNEYNRHSVYARTLSFKYKVKMIHDMYDPSDELKGTDKEWDIYTITSSDIKWKIYEHMRWNMYTRSLGFVLADNSLLDEGNLSNRVRSLAKVHNDLVDYSDLSKEEQDKDALKLTPEIVEILRGI